MKALVTAEWTAEGIERLQGLGYEVATAGWGVTGLALRGAELADAAADAELLLVEAERIDAEVLRALEAIRVIGTARSTAENIDLAACTDRGVPVLHAPARSVSSVADFVLGLIVTSCRGIGAAERQLREQGWFVADERPGGPFRGPELAGRTLGLIGYGEIGRAVAQRAELGFHMRIVFYDPDQPRASPSTTCSRTPTS